MIKFDESTILFRKKAWRYTAGEGIVIGKNIKKNQNLKDLTITSIVPSILYYLVSPIPIYMDGKIEEQLFTEGIISHNPPKYENEEGTSILSRKDEALIIERLKRLGYVE